MSYPHFVHATATPSARRASRFAAGASTGITATVVTNTIAIAARLRATCVSSPSMGNCDMIAISTMLTTTTPNHAALGFRSVRTKSRRVSRTLGTRHPTTAATPSSEISGTGLAHVSMLRTSTVGATTNLTSTGRHVMR